ncbi:MAG: tRNA pseudouridine(55) synthase TruB [Firmicutes bacterium]|nr:tRNA pseudouridine(55) synthase TruB [Bacillota bacterium]
MANGILIVDKPEGWTSQDVVSKLRGVLHEKRVGHGGTLDPMATGVLPVFVGRATRAVEFFEHAEKSYEATLLLGVTTDTQDTSGTVLETRPVTTEEAALREALARFTGVQQQLPPMYSAVKIGGKKLYELARAGKEIERKPREITIFSLELLDFTENSARLRVHCSKGTYIRTLCHDIGQVLGCGGCMASLRRVQAGAYTLAEAVTLDEILASADPQALLKPVDTLFSTYPRLSLTAGQEKCVRNGAAFTCKWAEGRYRVYSPSGAFLALCEVTDGKLKTVKSFFDPQ